MRIIVRIWLRSFLRRLPRRIQRVRDDSRQLKVSRSDRRSQRAVRRANMHEFTQKSVRVKAPSASGNVE
jgi:hypothetical protein